MEDELARRLEFRDPRIGQVLQGRYRLIELLGRGGMGVVYLAEHLLIERKFAIKMLHSDMAASEELVHRFHREARAAAAVGNEHVVDVTDMGRLEDGTYFIVLEYLDGDDLAALIEKQGPLPIARAVDLARQVCDALAVVHRAGIVHRDLKPENVVLIDRRGVRDFVKILDFGICKVLNDRPLTATGVALGTPRFMSPEQLEARPEVDGRADVYAVGAILYFALTAQAPFESESLPQLLVSIWSDPAPRLRSVRPDVSEALDRLVARALEKQPADRWQSSSELGAALAALAAESGSAWKPWAVESGIRDSATRADGSAAKTCDEGSIRVSRRRSRVRVVATLGTSIAVLCGFLYLLAQPAASSLESSSAPMPPPPARSVDVAPADARGHSREEAAEVAQPASAAPVPARPKRRKPTEAVRTVAEPLQPAAATEPEPPPLESIPVTPSNVDQAPVPAPPTAESDVPSSPLVPDPAKLKRVF